jgi:hypothetical protein
MNDVPHDDAGESPEPDIDAGEPVRLPAVEPTGHGEIDAALSALDRLADVPVTDHVATYDAIHHVVRTTLADAGRPDGSGAL